MVEDHFDHRVRVLIAGYPVEHHVANADLSGQGLVCRLRVDDAGKPEHIFIAKIVAVIGAAAPDQLPLTAVQVDTAHVLRGSIAEIQQFCHGLRRQVKLTADLHCAAGGV